MPASLYIVFKSGARTARSANSSAPIATRNTAAERGAIPNQFPRADLQRMPSGVVTENWPDGLEGVPTLAEAALGLTGKDFFTSARTIPHQGFSEQGGSYRNFFVVQFF